MLNVLDWGLIEYDEALAQQEALVEEIHNQNALGVLVFCTHPPVVTLGRKTQPGDVFAWDGPLKEISRGGRATYHGPSQLVVYPIYNLACLESQAPRKDIHWYLRNFEQAIVTTLLSYEVEATGKSLQKKIQTTEEETGVWVKSQKIASLGIAVRKWICFHGAAINLDEDPLAFQGMKPCGFQKETMTNLEKLLGHKTPRSEFRDKLAQELVKILS